MSTLVRFRLEYARQLRDYWLDNFSDGGLFIPGDFVEGAGERLMLEVTLGEPAATVLLPAMVVWRRATPRTSLLPHGVPGTLGVPAGLKAGVGVAFAAEGREKAKYLERLSRGLEGHMRSAVRYPTNLRAALRFSSLDPHEMPVRVLDVSVRGAKLFVPDLTALRDRSVQLQLMHPQSGARPRVPLGAKVVWDDPASGHDRRLGLALFLTTPEERQQWATVVTHASAMHHAGSHQSTA